MLIQHDDLTLPGETEVGHYIGWRHYLSDKYTIGRPHVQAIPTAAVNISEIVTFDAIWYAVVCIRKDSTIYKELTAIRSLDVICIAVVSSASFRGSSR